MFSEQFRIDFKAGQQVVSFQYHARTLPILRVSTLVGRRNKFNCSVNTLWGIDSETTEK